MSRYVPLSCLKGLTFLLVVWVSRKRRPSTTEYAKSSITGGSSTLRFIIGCYFSVMVHKRAQPRDRDSARSVNARLSRAQTRTDLSFIRETVASELRSSNGSFTTSTRSSEPASSSSNASSPATCANSPIAGYQPYS